MKRKTWLEFFRRSLACLWPQRRRIILAVACSLCLALSFAASLTALVPVLRLFIAKEGPRTTLLRLAAQRTYGVGLQAYRLEKHGPFTLRLPPDALVITHLDEDSPLQAEGAKLGEALYRTPDTPPSESTLLETLNASPTARVEVEVEDPPGRDVGNASVEVLVVSPSDTVPRTITLTPKSTALHETLLIRAARFGGHLLPMANTPQSKQKTLIIVFVGILVLVLVSNVCRFTAEYNIIIASNRAVMDLRRQMYRTVMHLPIGWFSRHLSETLSRAVTDFKDVERGYRALFGKLTTEPIKVLLLLAGATYLDWRITLFTLVLIPPGALLLNIVGRKIRKANRKLLASYAQMISVLNNTLVGIKVVRAYNSQTVERQRMWKAERTLLKHLLKIGRLEAITSPMLEVLGVTVAMAGLVYLTQHVFSGRLNPETFMLLVVFLVTIFDSIRKMAAVYPRLARADSAAERVFEIIDMPTEQPRDHHLPDLPVPRDRIDFYHVSYRYPEAEQPALQAINLTVRTGQRVALVGPNGSGKTTLIGLLMRFMNCDRGQILFDGKDIAGFSIASLRNHISLVTQDAVVFALSAFDNIAYGRPRATLQEVTEAAQKAHAHDFIERLPDGYDTVIGEFGATLSGGEKQRLALARAILRDAPIFVFDEATSQIDLDSERKIQQAMQAFTKGRTSFVIAHRIATITDADQIVVLDQGQLIDAGQHDELLARCELYKNLYASIGPTGAS